MKVLVVEDEPDTRELIQRAARGAAVLEVVTAGERSEALERCRADRPDVLVSDIGLPDMDGYELIASDPGAASRRGRRDAGHGGDRLRPTRDRTRALRAGIQAHVAKPVEPAELVATVASFADLIVIRRRPASN